MGLFTARNRQNPFAERKRRERAQREAEQETAAILADPDAMEAIAEAEAEAVAVPFDRNPESDEYVQAPDISTFATGGIVGQAVIGPASAPEEHEQVDPAPVAIEIPAETQAKIDAIMNRAIPAAAELPVELDEDSPVPALPAAENVEREAPAVEADEKRGRGRPRPQETIDRDNAVHSLLKAADHEEGVAKEALAISLGEKEQQIYSSLRQLTKEGRAESRYVKGHGYRWFAL